MSVVTVARRYAEAMVDVAISRNEVESIDNELRQRATKTTYFYQMSQGLASYGKHRSASILFDKIGRVVTSLNTSGIGELDPIPVSQDPAREVRAPLDAPTVLPRRARGRRSPSGPCRLSRRAAAGRRRCGSRRGSSR